MTDLSTVRLGVAIGIAALLGACGGADPAGPANPSASNLSGQVRPAGPAAPAISFYAASRFLEQASFGPTPASIADLQTRGLSGWIDAQMALPASKIRSPDYVIDYDLNNQTQSSRAFSFFNRSYQNFSVGADDQLRLRTNWVLSSFLVVSLRKIQPYGGGEYFNLLQDRAFGNYGDLLKAITLSPAMGFYLDNNQNRRQSLNENYARELMQLFSVGLVQLNLDGSVKRGADGKPLETYTQDDVVNATRALSGWTWADPNQMRQGSNFANYGKPMVAAWEDQHDPGPKTIMGKSMNAWQTPQGDLDSLVKILVEHPNTAPFVSLRLIQGLTTSDPSPAYLQRVATVFKQSNGNLGQVVRAILLDPEARAGDVPGTIQRGFGRIREPYVQHVALQRALGCQQAITAPWDTSQTYGPGSQQPLNALSVFNYYPPTHRVPGSLLLAPEQLMLNSDEFGQRLSRYHGLIDSQPQRLTDAGCDLNTYLGALATSDDKLLTLLGDRMFRGAMPPAVRQGLGSAFTSGWVRESPKRLLGAYIELAQSTPSFGVNK